MEDEELSFKNDKRAPRHTAAVILAWLFSLAFLLIVLAEIVGVLRSGTELSDNASTLLIATGSLLIGVTSSFLSRNIYTPPPLHSLRTSVGLVLSATLGVMLVIFATGQLAAQFMDGSVGPLSTNSLNVLTVLFAGAIGSLAGYLGFAKQTEDKREK